MKTFPCTVIKGYLVQGGKTYTEGMTIYLGPGEAKHFADKGMVERLKAEEPPSPKEEKVPIAKPAPKRGAWKKGGPK